MSGNLFLVLIAFFIYIGASQELHFTVIKSTLDGFRVRDLMTTDVVTVTADLTVRDLIDRMLTERHTGYPVVQGGRLVGCVTMEDIDKLELEGRDTAKVADIMTSDLISVGPDDDIYLALKHISENEIGRLPVLEGDRLVGILSRSDVMRGFQLRQLRAA